MRLLVLIDCHVHLNNYHAVDGESRPTAANVREPIAKMDERGVDRAVVITSYKVDVDRPSVEQVLDALVDNPRTSVVEELRWRGDEQTDLYALEERVRGGRVRGIKPLPDYDRYAITEPSLEAVFRLVAKHRVPVMVHTGDTYGKKAKLRFAHPLLVDDLAVDYPDVDIIIRHHGNPWFRDTAQVLYKYDNVYADICGLVLGQFSSDFEKYIITQMKEIILLMGDPGRQLPYGSDWPLVRMGHYVDFLENLRLPDDQMEALRWQNAARLFRIDADASRRVAEAARAGRA